MKLFFTIICTVFIAFLAKPTSAKCLGGIDTAIEKQDLAVAKQFAERNDLRLIMEYNPMREIEFVHADRVDRFNVRIIGDVGYKALKRKFIELKSQGYFTENANIRSWSRCLRKSYVKTISSPLDID